MKKIVLSNLSTYCTWKITKSSYKSNKFEISAPTWNNENTKKHEGNTDNAPIKIYICKKDRK